MKTILFVVSTLVIIQNSFTALPPDIPLCKSGDVSCIAKVVTDLVNKNPNGRKDLYMPNLEPLRINSLVISQGSGSALSLNLSFKDMDILGLSKVKFERGVGFTKDPTTSKFELYATVPKLEMKGQYRASGKILILPIEGSGPCNIVLKSVKVSIKFKPKTSVKNGKTYIGVDKLKLLLEPESVKVNLENLFNGDKTLGENMNNFINENWKDVWADLSPAINNGIAEVFRLIAENIFKISAYEDIYSD